MSKLKVDELEESTSGSNITVNTGSDLIVDDNIQLGHDSDTTLARASAGDISVEGNTVYRAGGTDVAVADGGTGAGTATAGFDALSPMTTVGDIMYGGSSGTVTRLAASTDGHVLTSTGAGSAPAWEAAASGDSNAGGVNGSAGSPTFSFASDTDTGMYQWESNALGFSVGGNEHTSLRSDGTIVNLRAYQMTSQATYRTLTVRHNGEYQSLSSNLASKTNIEDMGDVSWLYDLKPRKFQYRTQNKDLSYSDTGDGFDHYGFIAEEVAEVDKVPVVYDIEVDEDTGELTELETCNSLHYEEFIPAIVKALKELSDKVEALENA